MDDHLYFFAALYPTKLKKSCRKQLKMGCVAIDIITSPYFLDSILSVPVAEKYWRIILVLLRLSKTIRARTLANLPTHIRYLFQIAQNFHKDLPVKAYRKIITKLYVTGALKYFQMYCRVCNQVEPDYSDLIAMTPEYVYNWELCSAKFDNYKSGYLFNNNFEPINSLEYNPRKLKSIMMNMVDPTKNMQGYNLQKDRAIITGIYANNDEKCGQSYYGKMTIKEHGKRFELSELPLQGKNLQTYIVVLLSNRTFNIPGCRPEATQNIPGCRPEATKLITRFYKKFGARMPATGAWDVLMFAALFDLHLPTLCDNINK